jgi:hypothetical protein
MPESGTFGSVRGVPGNGHPYRHPQSETGERLALAREVEGSYLA